MDLRIIIKSELEKLKQEMIEKHHELGMKATGNWIKTLEVTVDGRDGKLLGEHYTEYLVQGRAPGSRPPISPIEDWVKAKFGLSGDQAKSAAFAVANKIAKEGTTWHQKGGSDLVEAVLTEERLARVIQNIGLWVRQQTSELLTRQLAA